MYPYQDNSFSEGGLMKSQRKIILLFALFFLMILFITGCGAKVSTILTINSQNGFSGNRVITCTVAKSDVQQNFKGGVQKIDEIFANSCPKEMTYIKTEDANNYIYSLTLPVSSLEDYKQKVEKIIGKEVNINYATPNTVFASGVTYSESFTSTDLMGWFRKVAQEQKLIDDINNLWELSDSKVVLNGKEYSSSGNIKINDCTYNLLNQIVINTELQPDGNAKRTIQFIIPQSTYDSKTNEINNFMKSIVPPNAENNWSSDTYGGKKFTITFNAKDAKELMEKTAISLNSKNCTLEQTDSQGNNPFSQNITYSEKLDFNSFASDSEGRVNIRYNFLTASNDKIIEVQQDDNKYTSNTNKYSKTFSTNILSIKLLTEKKFNIDSINVKTSIKSNTQVAKDIVFTYAANVPAEAAAKAKTYFESLKIPVLQVTNSKNSSGQPVCEIIVSGSLQEVNNGLTSLFGNGNSVQYTTQKKSIISMDGSFRERIDMSRFVSQIGYSKEIQYTIVANSGEKIKQLSISNVGGRSSKTYQNIGNTGTYSISPTTDISYLANKIILFGLIITILLILAIALVLVFLIKRFASQDGIPDKGFVALMTYYRNFINDYVSGISVPDKSRRSLIKYFYGSKWPLILVIITILQIPAIIGRILGLGVVLSVLTLIAALIWFVVERFGSNSKIEAIIDTFIESDFKGFKERALNKMGLVLEQVNLIDPILVKGPYYDFSDPETSKSILAQIIDFFAGLFRYKPKLIFKYGSDGKVRYSLLHTQIVLFSETQIYVYEIEYDLCTGQIFVESSTEYFYKNVNCVFTGEKTENIISGKEIIKKKFEFFKIVVSSGEYNHAVVDTEKSILENQIMAMRNLIREKKEIMKQVI